jgi:flavin-dependent dehydrogenase
MTPNFSILEESMKRIIIIGGGVAGLGAACKVTRAASEGHGVEFVLLERDKRILRRRAGSSWMGVQTVS